jgi:ATP phosphoribosyltransferase
MDAPPERLKVALPNKGRLADEAVRLMSRAGLRLDYSHDRKLFATDKTGRIQALFLRAADIPEFLHDGVVHVGITGLDIVQESGFPLEPLLDLGFGRCRLVVAVPDESPIRHPDDLPKKLSVATSFPRITKKYFDERGIDARIIHIGGAAEITPHLGVADLITDLTSTGSTLLMNGLREVDQILSSTAHVVARKDAKNSDAAELIDNFVFTFESVISARHKRYLLADVPTDTLDEVRRFLPGIAGPTVVNIAGDPDTVAIQVVVDESEIYEAVVRLKRLGGKGILVMPIDRMVA